MIFCLLTLSIAFLSSQAMAGSGITYHGRLMKPDGTPVIASNVQFKLQIRTPGTEDCLLYEEIQNANLSLTKGMFSLSLGDGTGSRQDGYSWTIFEALSNRKGFSFNGGDCNAVNIYAPAVADNRKFRVSFNDGTFAGWEALPIQTINYIPMSIESYAVGGFPASSLLRVETSGVLNNTTPLNNTQYNALVDLVNGQSNLYTKAGQLNGVALPALGNGESVRWNAGGWQNFTPLSSESDPTVQAFAKAALPTCDPGEFLSGDGTAMTCVPESGGGGSVGDATALAKGIVMVPPSGGLEVSSGEIGLPDQSLTPGSFAKVTVDQKGIVTAGGNLAEADIPNLTTAGKVSGGAINSGTIGGSTAVNTSGNIQTSGTITSTGNMTVTGGSGKVSATYGEFRRLNLMDDDVGPTPNRIEIRTPSNIAGDYTMTLPGANGSANQVLGMNTGATAMEYKSITGAGGISINHTAGGIEVSGSGVSPVGASLATGRTWIGDGSGDAVARYFNVTDIKNTSGNAQVPLTCTESQVLKWAALSDAFECEDISIESSNITDGTITSTDLAASLAEGLWSSGSGNVYRSTGNVGIGTTSATLNRLVSQRAAGAGSDGEVRGTDGTQWWHINSNQASSNYNPLVQAGDTALIYSKGSVEMGTFVLGPHSASSKGLRIDAAGNIGVGTATPGSPLHVNGIIRGTQFCDTAGANCRTPAQLSSALTAETDTLATVTGRGATTSTATTFSGGLTASTITAHNATRGGDIGIAMQSDVTAYMRLGMDSGYQQFLANNAYWTGSAYNYVSTGGYSGMASRIAQYSGVIRFDTTSGGTNPITWSNRLHIANDGKVGIGSGTPGYQLDVVGSTRTTGEMVSTSSNQARFIYGNYGLIHRNDGSHYYLLMTASGDQYGSWNALRPFQMNMGTGDLILGGGALTVTHLGAVTAGSSIYSPAYYYTSDARLKENVQAIPNALDKVLALEGVTFDWKKSKEHDIGFIAQDVEKVLPDLVGERKDPELGTVKTVKYGNIVAVVVEALKELYDHVMGLSERVAWLEKQNEFLKLQNEDILKRWKN